MKNFVCCVTLRAGKKRGKRSRAFRDRSSIHRLLTRFPVMAAPLPKHIKDAYPLLLSSQTLVQWA